MKFKPCLIIALCSLSFIGNVCSLGAEELPDLLKRVEEFANKGNYAKAIEELSWVKKELEKMNFKKIEEFFPDELAGLKGSAFETSSAMGMTNLERQYKGSGQDVKLSLTAAASGGPMGGLAGIGKMAAMMGGQPGMDSFRIEGRTATLKEKGSSAELSVFLDSGSVLALKGKDGSVLRKMAEAVGIEKLDSYLRGQAQ